MPNGHIYKIKITKSKTWIYVGFAAALISTAPSLDCVPRYLVIVTSVFLFLVAFLLYFHNRFNNPIWNELVAITVSLDVRDTAVGFGLVVSGISLIERISPIETWLSPWICISVILSFIGAFLIGWGMGKNTTRIKSRKASLVLGITLIIFAVVGYFLDFLQLNVNILIAGLGVCSISVGMGLLRKKRRRRK